MTNIDANNLILGRIATIAAKKALLGEEINIFNCEKAVITGNKKEIISKYKAKKERGRVYHGPYIFKQPYKFFKRTIRGMLPYKKEKGKKAFKRIKCYNKIPENLKDKDLKQPEKAKLPKSTYRYITIKEICKSLGVE